MTRKRNDSHSTEFGLWLRDQKDIDSEIGYTTTNIDYVWRNYNTGQWMIIEEKRHMAEINYPQRCCFELVHRACRNDKNYRGFYLLQFENTNPEDGKIYLNRKCISKVQLIKLLKFEK